MPTSYLEKYFKGTEFSFISFDRFVSLSHFIIFIFSYIFAMWTSVRKVASAASSYHENVAAAQSQSNERPSSLVVYLSYFWDKNIGAVLNVFMNVKNLLIFK